MDADRLVTDAGQQPGILRQQAATGFQHDGAGGDVLADPAHVAPLRHGGAGPNGPLPRVGVFGPQHRIGAAGERSPGHDPHRLPRFDPGLRCLTGHRLSDHHQGKRVVRRRPEGVGGSDCVPVHRGPPERRNIDFAHHVGGEHPTDAFGDRDRLGGERGHPLERRRPGLVHRGPVPKAPHADVGSPGHRHQDADEIGCGLLLGCFPGNQPVIGEDRQVAPHHAPVVEEALAQVGMRLDQGPEDLGDGAPGHLDRFGAAGVLAEHVGEPDRHHGNPLRCGRGGRRSARPHPGTGPSRPGPRPGRRSDDCGGRRQSRRSRSCG